MANKHRGEVEIVLDKIRIFRFKNNALVNLEDKLGHSISKINPDDVGIGFIRKMVWAALLHELPNLTLDEAGELMDYSNFQHISERVMEAFRLALDSSEIVEKKQISGPSGVGIV